MPSFFLCYYDGRNHRRIELQNENIIVWSEFFIFWWHGGSTSAGWFGLSLVGWHDGSEVMARK
jgi:hypothetical protein